jgi:hypothetical protein
MPTTAPAIAKKKPRPISGVERSQSCVRDQDPPAPTTAVSTKFKYCLSHATPPERVDHLPQEVSSTSALCSLRCRRFPSRIDNSPSAANVQ